MIRYVSIDCFLKEPLPILALENFLENLKENGWITGEIRRSAEKIGIRLLEPQGTIALLGSLRISIPNVLPILVIRVESLEGNVKEVREMAKIFSDISREYIMTVRICQPPFQKGNIKFFPAIESENIKVIPEIPLEEVRFIIRSSSLENLPLDEEDIIKRLKGVLASVSGTIWGGNNET